MSDSNSTLSAPEPLVLAAPQTLTAVTEARAPEMVPLAPETKTKVDTQLESFINSLLQEQFGSDGFKQKLDSAFRLGRKEIFDSAALNGRFMEKSFVGAEDSPVFGAIHQLRKLFDDLNPASEGDLLTPNKLFGLIPFGDKLQAYFRKFEAAGGQIRKLMQNLYSAQDEIRKDAVEIETTEKNLWDSMQKLRAAIYFAEQLDSRLLGEVAKLNQTEPMKARAIEQEVLFYARQSLTDMLTQQTINVNGYLSMGVLKRTAREMIIGCDRMATHGMSALAVATTVARATGNQIKVMEMLQGASATIGSLIESSSVALGQHVEKTAEFAANPTIAMDQLQSAFNNTFKAMDTFDNFRSQAIDAMGKNNDMLRGLLAKGDSYMERSKQAAQHSIKGNDDVVAL
ncbi:MAG: hypothetical protein RL497_2422 [Pseudomonadota bacterium]|jgi:uncharacterized protein YaaN involved in tellurite resistance